MKIKFQGFELGIRGERIRWQQYVDYLQSRSGQEIHYGVFDRINCLNVMADQAYILGLFVTIKDQKRFCEIRENHGQFELAARNLDAGSRMADFNFFIINKATKRGIYQYYHQSCSLQQFLGFLRSEFFLYKMDKINEIKSAVETVESRAAIAAVRHLNLDTEVLVRRETFDELLNQLGLIKEMRFDITTYDADSRLLTPLRDVIKKKNHRVFFKRNMITAVRQGILGLVRDGAVDEVKVKGISEESGLEMTIGLMKNIADFGTHDYDDLTEHLTVELDTFAQSGIIGRLKVAARENDYILG